MMLQLYKKVFSCVIFALILGFTVTSIVMDMLHNITTEASRQTLIKKADLDKNSKKILDKASEYYAESWKMQDNNHQEFISQLGNKCNGSEEAIITQANTPLHSVLFFSGEKKSKVEVTSALFDSFPKKVFGGKLDTCSVVGNSGILIDSKCGEHIDSAQFVFRCNLPPVGKEFQMDVGNKTDLVTANPSIFYVKFGSFKNRNKTNHFLETMSGFGSSYLLLPAFSFRYNTKVSLRAAQVIRDFKSPIKPIYFNPSYLKKLHAFWGSAGLREPRLSTGLMIVTLALELCNRVDLYGFWPFGIHPERYHALTNHYYDNVAAKRSFHYMPAEFQKLLLLHRKGVLRLHLGDCKPGEK